MIYSETGAIVPIVKSLLGLTDTGKDALIELLTDSTVAEILAYCRMDVLPYQLQAVAAQITAGVYRMGGYGSEELPQDVTSISEGDRSLSFKARGSTSMSGIMEDYRSRLEPWVNRRGRVPSDVG